MNSISEIQTTILGKKNASKNASEEEFLSIIKLVAPGTSLRTALDGTLKGGKGALIVVENQELFQIMEGGFRINSKFTSQKLIELAKMDGAIILSDNMKKINYANVLLTPDSQINSRETGTRHKAAERTAKQAKTLTIAISERKKEITIYYKNKKYMLVETGELLRKANENKQILEKQRDLFERSLEKLNEIELQGHFNLKQAINTIQKGIFIQKIAEELNKYCIELGKEGALLKIQLKDLVSGVERESDLIIKDYTKLSMKKSKFLLNELNYDELLDDKVIFRILNYENLNSTGTIKGWRLLSKTSLSDLEIAKLLKETESFYKLIFSNDEILKERLGEKRAKEVKEEIKNMLVSFN